MRNHHLRQADVHGPLEVQDNKTNLTLFHIPSNPNRTFGSRQTTARGGGRITIKANQIKRSQAVLSHMPATQPRHGPGQMNQITKPTIHQLQKSNPNRNNNATEYSMTSPLHDTNGNTSSRVAMSSMTLAGGTIPPIKFQSNQ
jgi:hypothetical protein